MDSPTITDLSTINDPNALKIMHYDALVAKEQADRNIDAINQRLAQLAQEAASKGVKDEPKKANQDKAKS